MTNKTDCPIVNCVTDGSVDYFPHKVNFEDSTCLNSSYYKFYKVSTVDCGTGTTSDPRVFERVLYVQCGCTVPDDVLLSLGVVNTTLIVPAGRTAIQSTSQIGMLNRIGALSKVVLEIGFGGTFGYVDNATTSTNPCFLENIANNLTTVVTQQANYSTWPNGPYSYGIDTTPYTVDFTFHEGYHEKGALTNPITVVEYKEESFLGQFEWIKLMSMPYNTEKKANEIYDADKEIVNCIRKNSKTFVEEFEPDPVTVMFAYRGWNSWVVSAACEVDDSFYCGALEELGIKVVGVMDGIVSLNDTEFAQFGKNVNIWLTSQLNIVGTLKDPTLIEQEFPFIKNFTSWNNKMVFDSSKGGENSWFEKSPPQPALMYEDLGTILYGDKFSFLDAQGTKHKTVFNRNIFTDAVGIIEPLKQCDYGDYLPSLAGKCFEFTTSNTDVDTGAADRLSASLALVVVVATVVVTEIVSVIA